MPSSEALPTGTVTFLFTDIEGSTRLAEQLGTAAWSELLEAHQTILREAFTSSSGREIKTEGDSFFVVFRSAQAAVTATVDAQRALATHPWPEAAPVRVRMGLHTGEGVLVPDGDYVGLDVHRAARIAAAGHGGQVLLSATTRALVEAALPAGAGLRDLGEHRLKDLSRPERIAQLVIEGLPDRFPSLKTLTNLPNNLPVMLTTFVGRTAEVARVRQLLDGTRLLTLTGPGGTGKTRLSLQLAGEVIDAFPDGVFFVALGPISDHTLVAGTIASVLGIQDVGGAPIEQRLADYLASRRLLLVLDNFEQVTDAAPLINDLLRSAPELKCVVTSRAVLHVTGEQEFPVPPLGVPDTAHLPPLEALTQYEAVALFIARARTVRPDFEVDNENAPAVAEVCARLDGLPLAIELAAARIKLLNPQAMLARLQSRLDLFGAGVARDLPARQQTLRGAIAWSYDLLDEESRRLFRRLSVFVGGFVLEAAEAICGPAPEAGEGRAVDVLDGLSALVDQSLLRQSDQHQHARFIMLGTIREFAWEALGECGERNEIRRRHAEYFADFAERALPRLTAEDRGEWLDYLEHEHDNLRAAITWSVETGEPRVGARLGAALWRFWQTRGHLREGLIRLQAILDVPGWAAHPALRLRALEAAGGIAYWLGDITREEVFYEEALAIARDLGNPADLAQALFNLSFAFMFGRGDQARAVGLIDESLALFRQLGDEAGVMRATWASGNIGYYDGDLESAKATFADALQRAQALHDAYWTAWSLHMLGSSESAAGELEAARGHLEAGLAMMVDSGEITGIVLVLDDLAALAWRAGDLPRALRLQAAARTLQEQTGTNLAALANELMRAGGVPAGDLDADDVARYAGEGRSLTIDEAVAYAQGGEFPAERMSG